MLYNSVWSSLLAIEIYELTYSKQKTVVRFPSISLARVMLE